MIHRQTVVVSDAIIYRLQAHGGISRLFSETFPRMCDTDDTLHINLLTDTWHRQPLPQHPQITVRRFPNFTRYMQPHRLWWPLIPKIRGISIRGWYGLGDDQIWHSTYYTYPITWKGAQVVTVHDMIQEQFPDLFTSSHDRAIIQRKAHCIQRADIIICVSDNTRNDVIDYYNVNRERTRVIYHGYSNAFETRSTDNLKPPPTARPFMLYVGGRNHYKNFAGLLRAYSTWTQRKDIDCVVVGAPWKPDEQTLLAELGLSDSVHLLTGVDDEALCILYNQATCFVYPSYYEGFGIPLLEAMACGCPVVASHIPTSVEVAGECPVYFALDQAPESIRAALDTALSEDRNSPRTTAGLERARTFSWDRTARQTLEVYHALGNPA